MFYVLLLSSNKAAPKTRQQQINDINNKKWLTWNSF
jgi:hypothetical protein